MNDPVSPETSFFKETHLQYFEEEPTGCTYFITLDPALSKFQRADFTAFIVVGSDYRNNWYVVEATQDKLTVNEIVEKMFYLVNYYTEKSKRADGIPRFGKVGMEKFLIEQMLGRVVDDEMQKRDIYFFKQEIPQNTQISKENRIKGLQPYFENKKIFIKRSQIELIHQILYFPSGTKNDDLLDALKNIKDIAWPSDFIPTKPDGSKDVDKATRIERQNICFKIECRL